MLVIAPGMAEGEFPLESLPHISIIDSNGAESQNIGQFPVASAWGRIGNRSHVSGDEASGDRVESAESVRYLNLKAEIPALGSSIDTVQGGGVVIASDAFTGVVSVRLEATSDIVEIRPLADGKASPSCTGDSPTGARRSP